VHIGFQGKHAPRFLKNLPTAFANPEIVSSNLATEVSLGCMAGPFDSLPFQNFQVSPIDLVPKKNGAMSSEWHDSDILVLHMDASGTLGCGGIFGKKWFQGAWKPHQKLGKPGISIFWQEFFATVVACHIWGDLLQHHRIKFHCDNEAVVTIINTKRSRIPRVMDLLCHLTLLTLQHNIYIHAVHISSDEQEYHFFRGGVILK
jgi:hypothetical protein